MRVEGTTKGPWSTLLPKGKNSLMKFKSNRYSFLLFIKILNLLFPQASVSSALQSPSTLESFCSVCCSFYSRQGFVQPINQSLPMAGFAGIRIHNVCEINVPYFNLEKLSVADK